MRKTWNDIIPEHNALSVNEETCLALAYLYDDPEQDNFEVPWDWKTQHLEDKNMPILGSDPSDKFARLLDQFEKNGVGYHMSIVSSAGLMKSMNIPQDKAVDMMHKASETVSRRKLQNCEVENAVEYAYNQEVSGKRFVKSPTELDLPLIKLVGERGDIGELRKRSETIPETPIEVLEGLFHPQDILFIGGDVFEGKSHALGVWAGEPLGDLQFITPNPLKNKEDGRKLMNVAKRSYIVFESDIEQMAGNWDMQAGVIHKLESILRLRLVVWSGNKSLHAWYSCTGHPESTIHRFERMAVRLGADRASLRPSQMVRLPWGTRGHPVKSQKVIYYG